MGNDTDRSKELVRIAKLEVMVRISGLAISMAFFALIGVVEIGWVLAAILLAVLSMIYLRTLRDLAPMSNRVTSMKPKRDILIGFVFFVGSAFIFLGAGGYPLGQGGALVFTIASFGFAAAHNGIVIAMHTILEGTR